MNLTIQVPDEIVARLGRVAMDHRMSIEQLALEQLSSLVASEGKPGSPAALLRVMREQPSLSCDDTDELDAAIAAGRLAVRARDLF